MNTTKTNTANGLRRNRAPQGHYHTPPDYQGDIVGDLNRRRGLVRELETKAGTAVVTAEVPLAEMFGYANAIRSLSKGRAEYSMVPARFEIVPAELAAKVLARQ